MTSKLFFRITGVVLLGMAIAFTAPMNNSPAPETTSAEPTKPKNEKTVFNEGLQFLLDKDYRRAAKRFEEALDYRETFPEAHNNLAFCLRKISPKNNEEALTHYARAVELAPKRPEPYMYRGTLYVLMSQPEKAKEDLAKLRELKSALADELAWVIENKKEKSTDAYYGIFQKEL